MHVFLLEVDIATPYVGIMVGSIALAVVLGIIGGLMSLSSSSMTKDHAGKVLAVAGVCALIGLGLAALLALFIYLVGIVVVGAMLVMAGIAVFSK